ncbi:hypothetical protein FACS189491_03390 [Spirochaetia bacterium]|nr:hypothetical protein FACS1894137_12650 [Spirochaetia bacterium]GHV11696.1 hypothetical protein FACS189491_03390 [Spirochaetia bacterium]
MDFNFTLTDADYQEYLKKREHISNNRYRRDDEDIYDVLLSEEADMSRTPEGRQIIAALQSLDD